MSLLHIHSDDQERARRGRILAIILVGMATMDILLILYHAASGQLSERIAGTLSVLAVVGAAFAANRRGWVNSTSATLIAFMMLVPFILFRPIDLYETYIVMTVPVLTASFTLDSRSGLVVTALLIVGTLSTRMDPMPIVSMLTLSVVAIITYLFADSLEKANRQSRRQAVELAKANDALANTTEEQNALLEEQEHILRDQEHLLAAIQELSATVLQVADQVLLCPLVGTLTKIRMQEIRSSVLAAISEQRATRLIIDVTGQQNVSGDVVEGLLRLVKAARLLGCEVVLTGISASFAPTLVRQQRGLGELRTVSSLQQGLELALAD
ncbi:MAG TPA: STAS domain-containing protein [Herpetosiphonaceae bacterium]